MREYTFDDFNAYYGGAYVRNPLNEEQIVRVVLDRDRETGNGIFNAYIGDSIIAGRLDHNLLEWRHVKCPALGYRHFDEGRSLYYVSKGQHDGRPKGLNPRTIRMEMPYELQMAFGAMENVATPPTRRNLGHVEAREIHYPSFVSLREAVRNISDGEDTVGFALSNDAAVIIGYAENEQFVGLFKGRKVCASDNGKRFYAVNPDWDGIVERHFTR